MLTGSDESDVESGGAAVESSSHEKSQSRLKEKIKKLEERAVSDKPWQMGGEVAAPLRYSCISVCVWGEEGKYSLLWVLFNTLNDVDNANQVVPYSRCICIFCKILNQN